MVHIGNSGGATWGLRFCSLHWRRVLRTVRCPDSQKFGAYLQRCILWALRKDKNDPARWHPRNDQWTPFVDQHISDERPVDWLKKLRRLVLDAGSGGECKNSPEDPELRLLAQGYGASGESAVFAVELRGTLVADFKSGAGGVEYAVEHQV